MTHPSALLSLCTLIATLTAASPAADASKPSAADNARFHELLTALGDEQYATREQAHAALLAAGRPAWDFLLLARKDITDAEAFVRCGELLCELELKFEPDHEKLLARAAAFLIVGDTFFAGSYLWAAEQRLKMQQASLPFATPLNRAIHLAELESVTALRRWLFELKMNPDMEDLAEGMGLLTADDVSAAPLTDSPVNNRPLRKRIMLKVNGKWTFK